MHTIIVSPRAQVRGSNAVGMLDQLLSDACKHSVSDIHIQPEKDGVVVRYRIDGILRDYCFLTNTEGVGILTRLKVLTGGDVTEEMRPQDGGFRVSIAEQNYDIRLSVFPSLYGEKAVLRILSADEQAPTLVQLGLTEPVVTKKLKILSEQTQGFFLVTGPTGSGKTTTLYALLDHY